MSEFRAENDITDEEHRENLTKLGWTEEEFNFGSKVDHEKAKKTLKELLTFEKAQTTTANDANAALRAKSNEISKQQAGKQPPKQQTPQGQLGQQRQQTNRLLRDILYRDFKAELAKRARRDAAQARANRLQGTIRRHNNVTYNTVHDLTKEELMQVKKEARKRRWLEEIESGTAMDAHGNRQRQEDGKHRRSQTMKSTSGGSSQDDNPGMLRRAHSLGFRGMEGDPRKKVFHPTLGKYVDASELAEMTLGTNAGADVLAAAAHEAALREREKQRKLRASLRGKEKQRPGGGSVRFGGTSDATDAPNPKKLEAKKASILDPGFFSEDMEEKSAVPATQNYSTGGSQTQTDTKTKAVPPLRSASGT